jgi:sucrose-6-phosphate hydrolase SacC (GH32 family)
VGENEYTRVLYDTAQGELSIDRTQSGQTDFSPQFAATFRAPLEVKDGVLNLRMFVDRCSLEVFAQDGAQYGAAIIFPAADSQGIQFIGEGAQVKRGVLYRYS